MGIEHTTLQCKLSTLPSCCNLSISLSYNKSVKIRLVTTCHFQTYHLSFVDLLQLAETTCSKPVDNKFFDSQFATNLLATCNRLVANSLSQAMRAHPDIELLFQDVNRLVAICAFCVVFPEDNQTGLRFYTPALIVYHF